MYDAANIIDQNQVALVREEDTSVNMLSLESVKEDTND